MTMQNKAGWSEKTGEVDKAAEKRREGIAQSPILSIHIARAHTRMIVLHTSFCKRIFATTNGSKAKS